MSRGTSATLSFGIDAQGVVHIDMTGLDDYCLEAIIEAAKKEISTRNTTTTTTELSRAAKRAKNISDSRLVTAAFTGVTMVLCVAWCALLVVAVCDAIYLWVF